MKEIKALLTKYQSILKYGMCSVIAAIIEVLIGWSLLRILPHEIVITNTVAVILSACVHYVMIQNFVFAQKSNIESVFVYILSFGIGIVLQDGLIWLMYDKLLVGMTDSWRYLISKGISLVIPFFALYFIRSKLNQVIKERKQKKG